MLGDIFDHLLAAFLIKLLGDRGNLQGIAEFRTALQKFRIPELGHRQHFKLRAENIFQPDYGLLINKIDYADKAVFFADRKLQHHRMCGQPLAHRAHGVIKIGTDAIHFIYKGNARNAVLIRLTPHRFRLRLHTGNRVKNRHAAIQYAQGTFHLHGEIHVSRRINNVNQIRLIVAFPGRRGRRGGDGNAALALLLQPVHRWPCLHQPIRIL